MSAAAMAPGDTGRGRVRHADWDLDPDFLTVNHGSFGATPLPVRAAQRAWQDRIERQPSRFIVAELAPALRHAAGVLADFLAAPADSVAFLDNATTGCNAVLRSLRLEPDDEILILSHTYGAVRNAVRHVAAAAGARVIEAVLPFPDPTPDGVLAAIASALGPKTRLAVMDHITSASALVLPLTGIIALCQSAGVPVLVDGAHGPGQVDVDLTALGADWYVGNCHKWLCAPKGCAFIYARRTEDLHPTVISHGYGQGFLAEFDWTGTTDFSRFLAVTAAIAHHASLGGGALRRRNHDLAVDATRRLADRLGSMPGAGAHMTGAMGVVRLPITGATSEHALAIRSALLRASTDAPVHALDGALWLRLSAFAYNEPQDYVRLGDIVARVLAEQAG